MIFDILIIGSGAAGLAAAMYAGRYKMSCLVVGKDFGGETATAGLIENYPGILSVDGYDLVDGMRKQAEKYGAKVEEGEVVKLAKEGENFSVQTKEGVSFKGRTLLFAIGAQRRHLGLPGEEELTGKGVHYCWTCDGPLYGGKAVAMVGGGDSSVKGVNFLASYASKIYLITREKQIHAEPVNYEQMKKLGDKVEILYETQVKELIGGAKLEKVRLSQPYKGNDELFIDGLFIEIGFDPNTTLPGFLGVELDERGYIKVDAKTRTNRAGVFAAGDGTNFFGSFKQDITAAALGAVAATSAYEYLQARQ